jgi:hypothetical protein
MLDGMDNRNRDSADNWPTQQFWPASGPSGDGGHIPTPPGPAARGPHSGGQGPSRSRHVTRWVAGIAVAAVVAGGGTVALAAASHGPSPRGQAAPTGQAATLNTVLSSADSPSTADIAAAAPTNSGLASTGLAGSGSDSSGMTGTGASPGAAHPKAAAACARAARRLRATRHPVAAHRVRAVCRRRLERVRLLVRGIHGQFTFQTKKGAKTLAFERGTVEAVTASTVTVRAADGVTWTWHLVSNTVVRQINTQQSGTQSGGKQSGGKQGSAKVGVSRLADGQRVFVGGPLVGGADNARLIVIRPAASATAPTSPPAS